MLHPEIILETNDFVAVNKPAGLLSIPDREGKEVSLKEILQKKYPAIYTVHRLDRGTSGLIVFAKNEIAHKHLSYQFEERTTEKFYFGLVSGSLIEKKGAIDSPIVEHPVKKGTMVVHRKARPDDPVGRGKESLTEYEVLEDFKIYSWIQFRIHTGRTHQIRVHAKSIGHPVACDELYGDGKPIFLSSIKHKFKLSKKEEEEKPILDRLALHSHKLKFADLDENIVGLEAPLPKDLKATLQQLRKWKK